MFAVLGASGNIGSKVADGLLKRGEKVRVIARNPEKLADFKALGADLYLGQIGDSAFLTKCMKDCVGAFVMIPPDYRTQSLSRHYQKMSESIRDSIVRSGIRYVVNLSSFGAEHSTGTGPIQFLHSHEERLNKIEHCNIVHLRPAFFMENLLSYVPSIRHAHKIMTSLKADLPIPMVASLDVARVVTELLLSREFNEKSVRCVLGPRDVSMMEICMFLSRILEQKINYQQLSDQDCERAFVQHGVSSDVARLFVEMYKAFNSGLINTMSARNETNTTTTRVEDFLRAFRGIFFEDSDLGKQTESYQEENPPQH